MPPHTDRPTGQGSLLADATAPSTPVWTIGDPARGESQFPHLWLRSSDPDERDFVVGRSDPHTDWPRFQPGPFNGAAGFREHTIAVHFEAPPESEARPHRLVLHGFVHLGPCPDLRVQVNGHPGYLALRPGRESRAYLPSITGPIAAPLHATLTIPAGLVVPGANTLRLTTTAGHGPEPAELVDHRHVINGGGGELHWAGLSLTMITAVPDPRIGLDPLPLYLDIPEVGLCELVDLVVRDAPDLAGTTAVVTVGGHRQEVELDRAGAAFGDCVVRLPVPEWQGEVETRVVIRSAAAEQIADSRLHSARKWTLHVIPHVHFDFGYTDHTASVLEGHAQNLDGALDLIDEDPDYRFSADGSLLVKEFLRTRSGPQRERLLDALRTGGIGMNAWWAELLTGIASLEELYRGLAFAAGLERDHDVPLRYANLTDVPSYTHAVPSVLAAAGIDGFLGTANHGRAATADSDDVHQLSPVVWQGPDGGSVLAFFADHYLQLRILAGELPTVAGLASVLPRFVRPYERESYLPTDLPIVGTHSDNNEISDGYADLVARWNAVYAWPRLRFSTPADYLDAVRPLRDRLPMLTGDGGSFWEDGAGSHAAMTATYRQTQALLPAVEAASALVAARDDRFRPATEQLDRAWGAQLVGCEHTFASNHATDWPYADRVVELHEWEVAEVEAGLRAARDEGRRALRNLAAPFGSPDSRTVVVFNGLSWDRNLDVDLELDGAQTLGGVPSEQRGPVRDGRQARRYRIADVPAFGFRVLPITTRTESPAPEPEWPAPTAFSTAHYDVEVEPGTGRVTGLRHRDLGRDLLDPGAGHALADVLYVSGGGTAAERGRGSEATRIANNDPHLPAADLQVETVRATDARLRRTAFGWVLSCTGSGPSLPSVRTELRFFDDSDRIELELHLDKDFVLAKESVYVAFPFALPDVEIDYDRQQGWVNPARNPFPGACVEWFTLQHAVALRTAGLAVTWSAADAPLFTVGDIVRGAWPTRFRPANGTLFSWVMNNYWHTNTPAGQQGSLRLRYAFRPDRLPDPARAARFGRDLRTPALSCELEPSYAGSGDSPVGRLLRTDLPDHLAATVFAGRREAELIVRVQETAGRSGTATLWNPWEGVTATPTRPSRAQRCDAIEKPITDLPVGADGRLDVEVGPYDVITIGWSRS